MQFKQTLVRLFFLLTPFTVFSQVTTYLPQDPKEGILFERLEIKAQTDSILNFSKIRPYSRRQFIPVVENYLKTGESLTKVDVYNSRLALMNSSEHSFEKFTSKKQFLKTFSSLLCCLLNIILIIGFPFFII